jgi:hypothetical protein
MDNVQNCDNYINILSYQNYSFYSVEGKICDDTNYIYLHTSEMIMGCPCSSLRRYVKTCRGNILRHHFLRAGVSLRSVAESSVLSSVILQFLFISHGNQDEGSCCY